MRSKDIIGKKIIDAAGTELGEAEDFELDWETKSIKAIVLRAKEQLRGRLIKKKIGGAPTQDISIPVENVAVLGGVIILSTKLS